MEYQVEDSVKFLRYNDDIIGALIKHNKTHLYSNFSKFTVVFSLLSTPVLTVYVTAKELVSILIAALVWDHHWMGATVTSHCSNKTAVSVLNSRHSKDKTLS